MQYAMQNSAMVAVLVATSMSESMSEKYTVVIGFGSTGKSVIHFLLSQGIDVVSMDSREQPPGMEEFSQALPQLDIHVGGLDEALLLAADRIIVSPGISLLQPEIQAAMHQGVEIIGDIELFARNCHRPVIAVTGSNGKSTVVTLVSDMAKAAGIRVGLGGNIGTPALDLLREDYALYVLELSSFQLETLESLTPAACVVLNVSEDHMDRYDSFSHYKDTKQRIYQHCQWAVVNKDESEVANMDTGASQMMKYSLEQPDQNEFGVCESEQGAMLCFGNECLMPVAELGLKGRHNVSNALASLALGNACGFDRQAMIETLRSFRGLPHRCQWVRTHNLVDWYDDSKGTNVGATLAALQGIAAEKIVLIAGGIAKDADLSPLKGAISRFARSVVLIGQDAALIEQAIDGAVAVYHAVDMDAAVKLAADLAQPGDAVLLSPACASFDMFRNYQHRGEVFVNAVESLV